MNHNITTDDHAATLPDIFNAALAAVDPYNAVFGAATLDSGQLRVAGAGKATARMVQALRHCWATA